MATSEPSRTIPNRRILDRQFISEIVSASVKEFKISAGSNPGDGVAGNLLAITIKTNSDETHNIVLKSILPMTEVIDQDTLANAELTAELEVFPREIVYYREIAPMFQEIADKHNKILPLFSQPKYYAGYYKKNGLNDYIAIEDLRPSGYEMAEKFKGLNLEEMKWAMRGLATFHSVSYVLLNGSNANQSLCDMRNDEKSILNDHAFDKFFRPIYKELIVKIITLIKEMGEVEAASKIEKFTGSGYKDLMDLFEKTGTEEKYFTVLIHADVWTNNILYKFSPDGTSVEDVKFIDFQGIRFGNIYEDLIYFVFTSTTPEFRRNFLEIVLKIYFEEFQMVLKEIGGCAVPKGLTLDALNQTFHEYWEQSSCFNLVTIPFQLGIMPESVSPNLDSITNKIGGSANNKFSPSDEKEKSGRKSRTEAVTTMILELEEATRNSPIAKKWLLELTQEMKEHRVI